MRHASSNYEAVVIVAFFFARHAWLAYLLLATCAVIVLSPLAGAPRPPRFLTMRRKPKTSLQIH